jgi:hypothetical protein
MLLLFSLNLDNLRLVDFSNLRLVDFSNYEVYTVSLLKRIQL